MPAINRFLYLDQGTTFTANVAVDDFDLTGYSARSSFRRHFSSSNVHNFTCTVDVNNSVVVLSMNAAATSNVTDGRYMYDVEIYNGSGAVYRILEGILTVTPEVTR